MRGADHQVHDLTPEDVSKGMADGRYLLVDVREPNEVAVEAYPGAVVVPLSTFDPEGIPDPQDKQVVFACRSGKRSVTASSAPIAPDNTAINLGQCFPDDPGPEDIRRAAADAVMNGYNQYPSMMGLPELRQAIGGPYRRRHGLFLHP